MIRAVLFALLRPLVEAGDAALEYLDPDTPED